MKLLRKDRQQDKAHEIHDGKDKKIEPKIGIPKEQVKNNGNGSGKSCIGEAPMTVHLLSSKIPHT